jgi:hypothetical protein
MYAVMLIFFVANAIEGQLISTGAFEVELNGKYVFAIRCTFTGCDNSRFLAKNLRLKVYCILTLHVVKYIKHSCVSITRNYELERKEAQLRVQTHALTPTFLILSLVSYYQSNHRRPHSRTQSPSYARCDEGLWPNP